MKREIKKNKKNADNRPSFTVDAAPILDATWSDEQLLKFGLQRFADARSLLRRTAQQLWLAGQALSIVHDRVERGEWRRLLAEEGIPKSSAHEAIQLFLRVKQLEAIERMSPAAALKACGIRQPKRITGRTTSADPTEEARDDVEDETEAEEVGSDEAGSDSHDEDDPADETSDDDEASSDAHADDGDDEQDVAEETESDDDDEISGSSPHEAMTETLNWLDLLATAVEKEDVDDDDEDSLLAGLRKARAKIKRIELVIRPDVVNAARLM